MRPLLGPRHHLRVAVAVLLVLALVALDGGRAAAEPPGAHAPPVDAPVSDAFRPPPNPYAAGNRGLDYATPPGTEVRASAPGEVTFAGQVGGRLHVVVLHEDGLRTSYSFLAEVAVRRGQVVGRGEVVGTSGPSLHFGARAGERYVDPALLFGAGPVDVRLVPVEERDPQPPGVERRWLVRSLVEAGVLGGAASAARWLAGAGDLGARAVAGAGEQAAAGMGAVVQDVLVARARRRRLAPLLAARALAASRRSLGELLDDQRGCTPGTQQVPPPPDERRIVVLVAGYGSTGGDAEVLDVDTDALGYAAADRVQFSYAGGRVPDVGALAAVAVARYGPADSMVDLRTSGARLHQLLADIGAAHPGVPVDLIAHSQGGLVVREALSSPPDAVLPVRHVVTLGSPHHGAPAATLAGDLGMAVEGSPLGEGLASLTDGGFDPTATSVGQMAEGSGFLTRLGRRPLPGGVAFTSVAAAGDLVVPALSSTLDGATNTLVALAGPTAHGRLPGSPEAAREIALALGGAGPTCMATVAIVAGVASAAAVAAAEHGLGGSVAPAALVADAVAALLVAGVGAG